jgi:hypothetical protein
MSDIEIPWGDTQGTQRAIENVARGLHRDVEDGKRTLGELKTSVAKMADDLRARDVEIARLKERAALAQTRQMDGTPAELRQFVQRDATQGSERVQLWSTKRTFGGVDVGTQTGLLDCEENLGEWHMRAKDLAEAAFIAAHVRTAGRGQVSDAATLVKAAPRELAALGAHLERGPSAVGKLAAEQVLRVFNDTNGTGGEFIPDEIRLPLLDKALGITDYGLVTDNLAVMEMSGKNIKMPFASNAPRPYKYGTNTIDDPSNFQSSTPGTADRTITPVGMAISIPMDRDAIDDSIVDALPEMRLLIARAAALGREDAVINGDTAATHQDAIASWNPNALFAGSGGGSSDHRRSYLGWRARAFDIGADAKLDTGTGFTYAESLSLAAKLAGTQSIPGQDLALVCSYEDYLAHILGIEQVATLDKYGPQAAVLSGEVARLGVWRVLKTPVLTQDMAATGLYTGSGSLGTMVGVNLSRYQMARRRGLRVELATEIRNGMVYLVATMREVLHSRDAASVRNVAVAINV